MIFNIHNINAQQNAYIEYYGNGNPKAIGFKTSQGTTFGEWTYYREDGSIHMEIVYNEQGKPQGSCKMYFDNGQLNTKCNYSRKDHYELEGSYEDYYKNGQLKSSGAYKQNKTIGKWITYFENGQIKSLAEYTNEGVIQKNTTYYENGQLRTDARYNKNGDYTGKFIFYYSNGQIRITQEYDDLGNKVGTYKSYYPNGNLKEIGDYAGIDYFQKKALRKRITKTVN